VKLQSEVNLMGRSDDLRFRAVFDGKIQECKTNVKPYGFVEKEANHGWRDVEDTELVTLKKKRVVKLNFETPSQVGSFGRRLDSKGIRVYEMDIPYVRRVLVDKVFMVDYDGCGCYVDIEVDDNGGWKRAGEGEIKAVSVGDEKSVKTFLLDGDEKEFLKDVIVHLENGKKTVVAGWNVDFDLTHLRKRCRRLNVDAEWLDYCYGFDMRNVYRSAVKGLTRYSLEEVAVYEGFPPKTSSKRICEMTRQELETYNRHDVELLQLLNEKYHFLDVRLRLMKEVNLLMSMNTAYQIGDSVVLRRLRELGYVAPTVYNAKKETYEGAYVMEPVPGRYRDVVDVDVVGMYPTIIMMHKIDVDGLRGECLPYLVAKWVEEKKKAEESGDRTAREVYKMLANSMYGLFGFAAFRFYDEKKAATVTEVGRKTVLKASDELKKLGFKVIYADSVLAGTPLLCKEGGQVVIKMIDDVKSGDYVLDESGWVRVKHAIKKDVEKRMYRVETWTGVVTVTEDHSLIDRNGSAITPKQLRVGDLLRAIKYEFSSIINMGLDEAWLLGYFVADGFAKKYEKFTWKCPDKHKVEGRLRREWQAVKTLKRGWKRTQSYVHLDGQNKELLLRAKSILEKLGFKAKLYAFQSNKTSGGMVYRLDVLSPVKSGALEYFARCYYKGKKKVPDDVLNASPEVAKAFIVGYLAGAGSNKNKMGIWQADDEELVVYGLSYLARKAGFKFRYCSYRGQRGKRKYLRHIRFVKNPYDKRLKDDNEVREIEDLGVMKCVVYDLETESHHFEAGGVLLHNTDGLFYIDSGFSSVSWIGDYLSWVLLPFKFEVDYKFKQLLMFSSEKGDGGAKKRYAGVDCNGRLFVRGLELRRRDWCSLSKKALSNALKMIFDGKSKSEILDYYEKLRVDLFAGKYDDELVITKEVKGEYKANVPHKRAWDKAVSLGLISSDDREVSYVWSKNGVEPYRKGVAIDYERYWTKQMIAPLKRLLSCLETQRRLF